MAACTLFGTLNGCASLTFPVSGIPARRVPVELLAEPREDKKTIDLALLRQKPPNVYRLAANDVLGVWIEGVLGSKDQPIPVQVSEQMDLPPAMGYPVPVREDGTLPLPLVHPVRVEGMSMAEAEEAIRKAYMVEKQILQPGRERIVVTLMRPRQYHVLVIRQEGGGEVGAAAGGRGAATVGNINVKRGIARAVNLPAYKNDVLNALAETGGLPGLDATNEIVIQRSRFSGEQGREAILRELEVRPPDSAVPIPDTDSGSKTVRIPLRMRPGEKPSFKPEDIVLQAGDIVFIEARDSEVFYTGGLLPTGEFPLPRDYDLDVIEAIARVSGPLASGGAQTSNTSSGQRGLVGAGIGDASPSLAVILRRTQGGQQVPIRVDLNRALRDPRERILIQPGDIVLLQQTPGEAIARYLTGVFRIEFVQQVIRGNTTRTATASVPTL